MSNRIIDGVRLMANNLKDGMSLGENGSVIVTTESIDKAIADDGLTMDEIKKVNEHRDVMLAGIALALGEYGIDNFKTDKKLEQVSTSFRVVKDDFGATFHRKRTVPDGKGGTSEKAGVVQLSYSANGQKTKAQVSKVKKYLSDLAQEVLTV